MAQAPARVIWSQEAFHRFQSLPFAAREGILKRVDLVRVFPRMYQVEPEGRWAGLRRFVIESLIVFYAYWESERTIYLEVIVPARSGRE